MLDDKHLKIKYTLSINGYENRNKVAEGLVNSGYIVSAELERDNLGRPLNWKIYIYDFE